MLYLIKNPPLRPGCALKLLAPFDEIENTVKLHILGKNLFLWLLQFVLLKMSKKQFNFFLDLHSLMDILWLTCQNLYFSA